MSEITNLDKIDLVFKAVVSCSLREAETPSSGIPIQRRKRENCVTRLKNGFHLTFFQSVRVVSDLPCRDSWRTMRNPGLLLNSVMNRGIIAGGLTFVARSIVSGMCGRFRARPLICLELAFDQVSSTSQKVTERLSVAHSNTQATENTDTESQCIEK